MMYKMMYMALNSDKFGLDKLLKQMTVEDLESDLIASVLE